MVLKVGLVFRQAFTLRVKGYGLGNLRSNRASLG